ncbi:MAG: methyltransferase [Pseudonocardiaceae bacterium]
MDPYQALISMTSSHWVTQAVYVAAKLGLADLLADGSRSSAQLADATGTHTVSLHRLLRFLAILGVVEQVESDRFALTPVGELLRADVPGSGRSLAIFRGEESYRAWGDLLHTVKTGEQAFSHVIGAPVFEYLVEHPERAGIFNNAMTSDPSIVAGISTVCDLSQFDVVVDVGGGNGTLLASVLSAHPHLRGVLFDRPQVVEAAKDNPAVKNVANRCELVAGDFFTSVPAGGDAYILSRVLHDWDDQNCLKILRQCRIAIPSHAKLLIVEPLLEDQARFSYVQGFDVNMMVMAGGRGRAEDEFRKLLKTAAFQLARVVPLTVGAHMIEAVAD